MNNSVDAPVSNVTKLELNSATSPARDSDIKVVELVWFKTSGSSLESWEARHPVIGSYQIRRNDYGGSYEVSAPFLAGKIDVVRRDDLESAKLFVSEHLKMIAKSLLAVTYE